MKYIMTEAQIVTAVKKFDKGKFEKGRFSDAIEEMTLDYLKGKDNQRYLDLIKSLGLRR